LGQLVLQMQISVDGFVASATHPDWQLWGWGDDNPWDPDLRRDFNTFFEGVDAILLSRPMVESGYIDHWTRAANAHAADPFYDFARRVVAVDKVVLSDRLKSSSWPRTTVASGDLPREVAALKAKTLGAIVAFGGVRFAAALLAMDLVDELQLYVNPAALGAGAGLFDAVGFRRLSLVGSKAYLCGQVVNRYRLSGT
jgi:dihydrofolate reductase